jgi:hypothetical protein
LPEKESYRSPRKAFTSPAGVKEKNRAKRRNEFLPPTEVAKEKTKRSGEKNFSTPSKIIKT